MKANPRFLLTALFAATALSLQGTDLYSIGQPTDEEQFYLELINRARANPAAEGARLAAATDPDVLSAIATFNVNLTVMQNEFNALPVRPPMAFNLKLMLAARGHSQDMFNNVFQGHDGSNGSTLSQRVTAQGYAFSSLGENVFSFASSVFHGHAGFQIDWGEEGDGTGMQIGRGHRTSIHSARREVGIGMVLGSKTQGATTVGPQLVTQDFGTGNPDNQAFVTGVAFYDLNGNSFYDPGEGVGGLTVNVAGSAFHAVTANSGGYTVPVPTTNTTRAVTFAGLGLNGGADAVISGGANVKVDFAPAYSPPVLSGPVDIALNEAATHSFTTVGGATGYELRAVPDAPVPVDGAENLGLVTAATTGAYTPRSTTVKHAGTSAYRLTHPAVAVSKERLTYNAAYLVQSGGALSFRSRLRLASADQTAQVQVSTDGGFTWQTVFSQSGTGGAGEGSFQLRNISLAAFEGREIRVRFEYAFPGGSLFAGTQDDRGWFIDEISFTNLRDVTTGAQITAIPPGETDAHFTPATLGTFLLAVRPVISARAWPFGPAFQVNAVEVLPLNLVVRRNGVSLASGGAAVQAGAVTVGQTVQIEFTLHNTGDTDSLTGIAAAVAGAGFSPHTDPSGTLLPGAQTSLVVEFTPPAQGAHTGSIEIASNDPDSPLFVINLSGTGVIPPPVIHDSPVSQIAGLGGNASFTVNATGIGITFQWLKNNQPIPGATTDTLNLAALKTTDAAIYRARVTAGGQSVTSGPARLAVLTSPSPLVQVKEGGTATLACALAAPTGAVLAFQWQKGGGNLGPADKPKGHNTAKLAIAKADASDAAVYRCLVSMTLPAAEGGAVIGGQTADSQLQIVLKPVMNDPGFGADFVSETLDGKYTLSALNSPAKFTAAGLPPGVKLNAATGALTGKPLAAKLDKNGNPAPYPVKLSASNIAGASPVITVNWTVQPLPANLADKEIVKLVTQAGQFVL
ncbi:MAG TPA: immunoglobulin domain-containing protein, partial [Prosthecobacter sp.]|nr:immunoglobulin domain-containing protein [Prosthecobacter sp.]